MGWCGWPASVPAGAEYPVVVFAPWDFAAAPVAGADNPPLLVTCPTQNTWFSTAIRYPVVAAGGSWAHTTYLTGGDVDATWPPQFRILWTSSAAAGICGWEVDYTSVPDSSAMSVPTGGTNMSDTIAAVNDLQITGWAGIVPSGVGDSYGPNRALNIRVYRGNVSDNINGPCEFFVLQMRYKVS